MNTADERKPGSWQCAFGKVILFGEHAVVYGVEAIAGGIAAAVRARIVPADNPRISVSIPAWGLHFNKGDDAPEGVLFEPLLDYLLAELAIPAGGFSLELAPEIPHASGLGASAAVAVSTIRALSAWRELNLDPSTVNQLAFGCEKIAHGSPSGLDNTLATFGGMQRYRRTSSGATFAPLNYATPIPLIVALSGKKGFTAATVKRVTEARARQPALYDDIFGEIAAISAKAIAALEVGDLETIAQLMNLNQAQLQRLGVSCAEIEDVIALARRAGAPGAKLTGSGDGGAVIIAPGDHQSAIIATLRTAGYDCFTITLGQP